MAVTVTIRHSGMRVFMNRDVRPVMRRWQRSVEIQIRVRAHGRIRSAVEGTRVHVIGYTAAATVQALTGFSLYPDQGTGVYVGRGRIYPKRARALRFVSRGQVIFAKSIKGQPAQHFMQEGLFSGTSIVFGGARVRT